MIDYGHGIYLSHTTYNDRNQFFQWRNEYDIWKWCRQNGPISKNLHESYWYSVDNCEDKKFFSIINKETSNIEPSEKCLTLVGCAGLTSIDNVNSRAEFSLYIGPEHHKKGYGKKALKTLIDHAFKYLNLKCVWGETFEGNPALKMFLDIGMSKEGIRRQFYYRDGKYIDCTLVSILRDEWKQSQ